MVDDARTLLEELRRWGGRAELTADTVAFAAPKGAVPPELRSRLAGRRVEVCALVVEEELRALGLVRCQECRRFMPAHYLERGGRCKDRWDCVLAKQLAWRARNAAAAAERTKTMDMVRMADMRRENLERWLAEMEADPDLHFIDQSGRAKGTHEDGMEYLRSRIAKFTSDIETLKDVEVRDFGWTPSGYVRLGADGIIRLAKNVSIRIADAKQRHVRQALDYELSLEKRDRVQIDYLESRIPRFLGEAETLLELETRLGWLGPPCSWGEMDDERETVGAAYGER